jgi:SNF2 family DNA or RNA helicase
LLDLLEPQLVQRGLVFERLDGKTKRRDKRVARFQTDAACPLFLISLKAGGYGLNLTAAGYVFLLDPWWNPAVEMQAIDRAHRIGQQRTVNAYRLVCRGTVEERVLELQGQKKALCDAILGGERSLLQDLTRTDLELLLG